MIRVVFSTSDMYHAVVTPALLLLAQMLSRCHVETVGDIWCGLYLCCVALSYLHDAKRYMPEALCFLAGVLSLVAPASPPPVVLPHFSTLHQRGAYLLSCSTIPKAKYGVTACTLHLD